MENDGGLERYLTTIWFLLSLLFSSIQRLNFLNIVIAAKEDGRPLMDLLRDQVQCLQEE